MDELSAVDAVPGQLVAEITCPNCWHRFPPEKLLFIARHDSLIGDDIAGQTSYRRFLPTRFNLAGDALDARGMVCQQIACPRCHLEISRPLIEMMPFFTSIVGAPASGKSYFLSAMTWEMRMKAPQFGFVIADGDPTANYELQRYEETLFMNPEPDKPVALRKTEIQGTELYQTIVLAGQSQTFPRPFQFTITPTRDRSSGTREKFPHRALVLYDNAGEHFLPGQDSTNSPVTLHLAESAVLFFVFDPTQDPRFRQQCQSDDPQLKFGSRLGAAGSSIRQEVILNEMAARVRRYKGLSQTARHRRPLVIILAKADIWLNDERFNMDPVAADSRLDLQLINRTSRRCRDIMKNICPEIVSIAEGFCKTVVYVPVSSLGTSPEIVQQGENRFYGIRPNRIKPRWVTVPMLWALSQAVPGLIATDDNNTSSSEQPA